MPPQTSFTLLEGLVLRRISRDDSLLARVEDDKLLAISVEARESNFVLFIVSEEIQ